MLEIMYDAPVCTNIIPFIVKHGKMSIGTLRPLILIQLNVGSNQIT